MKIGHEEASEKEKADFLHSLSLKHFAEWSKYSNVTVISLKASIKRITVQEVRGFFLF